MILAIKTDAPQTELYILSEDGKINESYEWQPGRELSVQLLSKIQELLDNADSSVQDVRGVVIYKGPGSFTGLRIGFAVANSLGFALQIPVVSTTGDDWLDHGVGELKTKSEYTPQQPFYGADPHITQPRK